MRKWIFCIVVLAVVPVLSFGGFGGEDVGMLQPVQVVAVKIVGEEVQLLTDTGSCGIGLTVREAVTNMKETSPTSVFLDTAEYLLVEPGAERWLSPLRDYFRPSCHVCFTADAVDLEQAGKFLQLHEPKFTLTDYEAGQRTIPYLISEKGRLKLERP